ncbi:MAG TPA: TonB-dependent receptor [Candidatus Eisenbacteria bacterium]|jgi:outer membrane cobalamin receptor|nr:TonB-dependent receptor [Candidatus Eisenbacteria bacterium]
MVFPRPFTASLFLTLFAATASLVAQSNSGEIRLKVTDPSGLGVRSEVALVSDASEFRKTLSTDDSGELTVKRLPFGVYRLKITGSGFTEFTDSVEVRSAVPFEYFARLTIAAPNTSVVVNDSDTLIDPHRIGDTKHLGADAIANRQSSLPGRSLQDLVNSQPGWLYEGNAVLHPRGSEYQTQVVVDGLPLTDNRSPSFGPEIEADDIQSLSIYTATFPAEYGRKMGGVIEVNTARDPRQGLHGQVVFSGGSFDTAGAYAQAQYQWGKNTLGVSASGDRTDRYLNPVVPQNFTNTATTGGYSTSYERDLTDRDRLSLSLRHEFSRFQLPNEQLQQAAGQLQNGDNFETMGTVSYQHIFSPSMVGDLRGMVRDSFNDLYSNPFSTPVMAFQHNYFREGYFKGSVSIHRGGHEWKAGLESDAAMLHEHFNSEITDFSRFDPDTPPTFVFVGSRPDLEQSAFLQDQIRLGKWTVSAGLRWDHYQLVVNENAVSPRLAIARYFPSLELVLHASYDRIFQTPESENLLISSSPQIVSLSDQVLRLAVKPSHGNYFEVGASKGLFKQLRFDLNFYDRRVNNFADDDQLLSTAVSFPIAFDKASIYGVESKIEIPHWGKLDGFVSYSYMVGAAYLPVTGGLFLGDDASSALSNITGRFWVSQDQRNTVRTRFRYQFASRFWAGVGADYGSGLPFEFTGDEADAAATYSQQVLDRVNFDKGRVRPNFAINASAAAAIYKTEKLTVRLQVDGQNLNNRLNVIDFGGLFSGNAIAPPRSYALRLTSSF